MREYVRVIVIDKPFFPAMMVGMMAIAPMPSVAKPDDKKAGKGSQKQSAAEEKKQPVKEEKPKKKKKVKKVYMFVLITSEIILL